MKKIGIVVFFFLLGLLFVCTPKTSAQTNWYWPIAGGASRVSINPFGTLHDAAYNQKYAQYFPNTKWSGYHSGTDFETTADEKDKEVPIYAISDGTISYVGTVQGYGGVIIEKLSDGSHSALYGHIRLADTKVKTGQQVQGGQFLTNLGTGFSAETSGERKHLHLGIYNGTAIYFHGYEQSQATINTKWIDPVQFLQNHDAKDPAPTTTMAPQLSQTPTATPVTQPQATKSESFFHKIIGGIIRFFRHFLHR